MNSETTSWESEKERGRIEMEKGTSERDKEKKKIGNKSCCTKGQSDLRNN